MAGMIRICHVQHHSVLAGAQRSMLEILSALDRARFEIHVACQGPGPLADELVRRQLQVHFVPSMQRGLSAWRDWRAYREFGAICAKHRFHIVHTHGTKPGLIGRIAARRRGVPVVVHHMYTWPFDKIPSSARRGFYAALEQLASYYCDCLVLVNQQEYAEVLDPPLDAPRTLRDDLSGRRPQGPASRSKAALSAPFSPSVGLERR